MFMGKKGKSVRGRHYGVTVLKPVIALIQGTNAFTDWSQLTRMLLTHFTIMMGQVSECVPAGEFRLSR